MWEVLLIISLTMILVGLIQRRKAKAGGIGQQRFINPTYPGSKPFTPPSNDVGYTPPPTAPPPIPGARKEPIGKEGPKRKGLIQVAMDEEARRKRETPNANAKPGHVGLLQRVLDMDEEAKRKKGQ